MISSNRVNCSELSFSANNAKRLCSIYRKLMNIKKMNCMSFW